MQLSSADPVLVSQVLTMGMFSSVLAVAIAIFAAGLAAAFGVGLAWPDYQSLAFVALASGTWLALFVMLVQHVGRLGTLETLMRRAASLDDLAEGPWAELAAQERAALVPSATSGKPPRRTRSAADLLRNGSRAVPALLNPFPWLQSGQAVLVSIGLFGTFFGLSFGLKDSIPCISADASGHQACVDEAKKAADARAAAHPLAAADASAAAPLDDDTLAMQEGMTRLLGGARTAFSKSVAGVGLGLSYMLLWRLSERRRSRLLTDTARRVDGWHEYATPEELARERMSEVTSELRALRAAQPDTDALTAAAASLARGAASLEAVGRSLGGVSTSLATFSADTLAKQVADGVDRAVSQRLQPAMDSIAQALHQLHRDKEEQDERVRVQLSALVDDLRVRALDPMSAEVQATNVQTRRVAEAVAQLGASVASSSEAVRASSEQMRDLTGNLANFQEDALVRLADFAKSLQTTLEAFTVNTESSFRQMGSDIRGSVQAAEAAMAGQRSAFEASAAEARRAFSTQTEVLTAAGGVASDAIRGAGIEAGEALRAVRGEFVGALAQEREALAGVLRELDGAFKRDLSERNAFALQTAEATARVQDVVKAVSVLAASAAAGDAAYRAVATDTSKSLARALADLNRSNELLYESLTEYLNKTHTEHQRYMKELDEHIARILNDIHGTAEGIARVVHEVRTNADVRA